MSVGEPTAAGVTIPDTMLARDATGLIRDRTSDLVYHQLPPRLLVGPACKAAPRDLGFDPEVLYVAAMFYDLGLNG